MQNWRDLFKKKYFLFLIFLCFFNIKSKHILRIFKIIGQITLLVTED
jgi:hypothetical protein